MVVVGGRWSVVGGRWWWVVVVVVVGGGWWWVVVVVVGGGWWWSVGRPRWAHLGRELNTHGSNLKFY